MVPAVAAAVDTGMEVGITEAGEIAEVKVIVAITVAEARFTIVADAVLTGIISLTSAARLMRCGVVARTWFAAPDVAKSTMVNGTAIRLTAPIHVMVADTGLVRHLAVAPAVVCFADSAEYMENVIAKDVETTADTTVTTTTSTMAVVLADVVTVAIADAAAKPHCRVPVPYNHCKVRHELANEQRHLRRRKFPNAWFAVLL